MGVGDEILLVERKWPIWTIERVQEYLNRNTKNSQKLLEASLTKSFMIFF